VREQSKGLIVLLSAAALAGVLLEVQRHEEKDAASAAASASASAAAASLAAPRAASKREVEQALERIEGFVRAGASDERSPWALAHGLLAFGAEHRTGDGRPAIDVIGSFAEQRDGRYGFPERNGEQLVEPHPHLLVKTLLELDLPRDRELVAADGSKLTLARLVADLPSGTAPPATDAEWRRSAWLLSALTLRDRSRAFGAAALERLEAEQRAATDLPLATAKQRKAGLYGHACGGFHFVQAVILAISAGGDPAQMRRIAKQLGALAFRYETEREALARVLAKHPEQALIVRVQQLELFGHLLETLMLARTAGAYRLESEGGKKLDAVARQVAADLADVAGALDRDGLSQIRSQRGQTYLDLVAGGCHAIRGLRQVLALYPK
jgi:hypothetical protein